VSTPLRVYRCGQISIKCDRRTLPVCAGLAALLLVLLILSVMYGDYVMSPLAVLQAILTDAPSSEHTVVWQLRLPRILLAIMVGIALGVAGGLLQGITRNPLADPGIIGINQGAAVMAVAVLVWSEQVSVVMLPVAAFLGGTLSAALIYSLAWKEGSSPIRLVLVGIGFAAFTSAVTQMMIVFGDIDRVDQAYTWLAGSVYGRDWQHVHVLAMCLALLLPIVMLFTAKLDVLMQGDAVAKSLGVKVEWTRLIVLLLSVALSSAAVSAAGIFGFLGLVAPHIARQLVGVMHIGVLPTAGLVGAVILVAADLLGRSLIAPNQIPAGLVTAILGAPYFFWLLRQHYKKGA